MTVAVRHGGTGHKNRSRAGQYCGQREAATRRRGRGLVWELMSAEPWAHRVPAAPVSPAWRWAFSDVQLYSQLTAATPLP